MQSLYTKIIKYNYKIYEVGYLDAWCILYVKSKSANGFYTQNCFIEWKHE